MSKVRIIIEIEEDDKSVVPVWHPPIITPYPATPLYPPAWGPTTPQVWC